MFRAAEILDQQIKGRSAEKAVEGYLELVKQFPKSEQAPIALFRAAQLHEKQKAWKKAIALYKRIEEEYGKSEWAPRALRRWAEILEEKLEKPKEAAEVFKRLIEKYPDSKEAKYARSRKKGLDKQNAAKEAKDYQSGRYGGGGGGTIYDQSAQWTEARKKLYRAIAKQKLDVLHLDCDIAIDPAGKKASFKVAVKLTNGGKTRKELLFFMGMGFGISKVTFSGSKIRHEHKEERLVLYLDEPFAKGQTRSFTLTYGLDQSQTKLGPLYLVKLGEDGFAMADIGWYPGNVMGDLFKFTARYRVPRGYRVVSLGEQTGKKRTGGKIEYTWKADQPVFGLYWAYGRYVETRLSWGKVDLRLLTFKKWHKASETLEVAKEVLTFYAKRFGAYPYKKMWIAEVALAKPFSGVGPASLLYLNTSHFQKPEVPLTVLAHEVAHQWWGNQVPISLFNVKGYSQWLSEGFATYSEVMFMEHKQGKKKMRAHLDKYRDLYLKITPSFYEPPLSKAVGGGPGYFAAVYMKGCWVLHMLRWRMGDKAFLQALSTYLERFRWKGSRVADFRKICEEVSGKKFGPFFKDWVEGIGCVRYDMAAQTVDEVPPPIKKEKKEKEDKKPQSPTWKVSFELRQKSTKVIAVNRKKKKDKKNKRDEKKDKKKDKKNKRDEKKDEKKEKLPFPYRIPVELLIQGPEPDQQRTVLLELKTNPQRFEFTLPWKPKKIVLDPNHRLLKVPGKHNQYSFE